MSDTLHFFNNKLSVTPHQDKNRWVIHYDTGGTRANWPEDFREEFATELHGRLIKFDPKTPMYQNGEWNPRRKRLSIPLGEIVTQKRHVNAAVLTLLSTVMDMGVYEKQKRYEGDNE